VITLKEFLAEPQTMYDGGLVYMQDGGDPLEKLIDKTTDLRQRTEFSVGKDGKISMPEVRDPITGDIIGRESIFVVEETPVTEQQLPITTKPTLPVPKSLESKLPRIVKALSKRLPAVQIAAQVLDLIPQETKAAAVDYLKNTPTHELFGLEKSGLESVEDLWEEVTDYLDESTEEKKKGGQIRPMYDGGLVLA